MPITIASLSPIGVLIDLETQAGFLSTRPEAERARVERDLRAQQQVFDDAAAEVKQAAESGEFTPLGQREAVKRAIRKAVHALKTHETTAKQLQTIAADTRTKALQPRIDRNAEVLVREREIRDRLAGTDPLAVFPQYLSAIEKGDWEFVSAVENAPRSFPLVNADMLEAGSHAKLARSPLAGELAAQEATAHLHSTTAATVRTELTKLAERALVTREEADLE